MYDERLKHFGGGGGVVIDDGGAVEVVVWWLMMVEPLESCQVWKKWRLEMNNKERLKNNILIKIEFWDVEVL